MEHNIRIGSEWINKSAWGDVQEYTIMADQDKRVIFKVVSFDKLFVKYTINYPNNAHPNKIFKDTIKQFLIDCKPRPVKIELKDCADIVINPTDNVITDRPYGFLPTIEMAAKQTGRKNIGAELDTEYYKLAKKKLDDGRKIKSTRTN